MPIPIQTMSLLSIFVVIKGSPLYEQRFNKPNELIIGCEIAVALFLILGIQSSLL